MKERIENVQFTFILLSTNKALYSVPFAFFMKNEASCLYKNLVTKNVCFMKYGFSSCVALVFGKRS